MALYYGMAWHDGYVAPPALGAPAAATDGASTLACGISSGRYAGSSRVYDVSYYVYSSMRGEDEISISFSLTKPVSSRKHF